MFMPVLIISFDVSTDRETGPALGWNKILNETNNYKENAKKKETLGNIQQKYYAEHCYHVYNKKMLIHV